MKPKLLIQDIRAVDLLLDRGASASRATPGRAVFAGADPAMHERVQAAHKMLHLLDAIDAGDPPADLTTRTMKRIERASYTASSETPPASIRSAHNGPMA